MKALEWCEQREVKITKSQGPEFIWCVIETRWTWNDLGDRSFFIHVGGCVGKNDSEGDARIMAEDGD